MHLFSLILRAGIRSGNPKCSSSVLVSRPSADTEHHRAKAEQKPTIWGAAEVVSDRRLNESPNESDSVAAVNTRGNLQCEQSVTETFPTSNSYKGVQFKANIVRCAKLLYLKTGVEFIMCTLSRSLK